MRISVITPVTWPSLPKESVLTPSSNRLLSNRSEDAGVVLDVTNQSFLSASLQCQLSKVDHRNGFATVVVNESPVGKIFNKPCTAIELEENKDPERRQECSDTQWAGRDHKIGVEIGTHLSEEENQQLVDHAPQYDASPAEERDQEERKQQASIAHCVKKKLQKHQRLWIDSDLCGSGKDGVVAKALGTLADSCRDPTDELSNDIRNYLVDHGAVEWILMAMRHYSSQPDVQSRGCRALQNIMCHSVQARDKMCQMNGVRIVCEAMRDFSMDRKVQRDGCGALFNYILQDKPDHMRKESLVQVGGVGVLVAALVNHPPIVSTTSNNNSVIESTSKLQEWSCRAIVALCKGSERYRHIVWTSGGFTAILAAREQNPNNLKIVKAAQTATRRFWKEYEHSQTSQQQQQQRSTPN